MPRLSPFHGLVFDAAVVGPLDRVTAPPYDVISDQRRLELLGRSPFSVVHLDLAEGSDDPADPASRYGRAAQLLARWQEAGALRRAEAPSTYVYEMSAPAPPPASGAHEPSGITVRGLICAMELEDWGGTVLPHEQVMEGPVNDRLALLRATRTHLSPVYGIVDGRNEVLDGLVRETASGHAPFEAIDEQGVRHRMWPVLDGVADLGRPAAERVLIADGHHRYTTALRYRHERRRLEGPGPWDGVLTLVVDAAATHLPVLPFHRMQLAGDPPPPLGDPVPDLDAALDALSDDDLTTAIATADTRGEVTYRIRFLNGEPPVVRALHEQVLDTSVPAGSLRYTPDAREADATLRTGDAIAVYLLPPTTPDRLRAVVQRGERLPQKSTYFWPKPRTGMVMMPLDPSPGSTTARAGRAS